MTLTLPSPAKINHFLHIIGKRSDGYHNLQTLFQFLDYGDTLHFSLRADNKIELLCDGVFDIPLHHNIIYKAAVALQNAAQVSYGVNIALEKIIPMGSGLGGGSSNAATTLLGLNKLWKLNWSITQLMEIGKKIGADVPIFIFGEAAWGEGIGEILTPASIAENWILVITPDCAVMTSQLFGMAELTRNTPAFKIGNLAQEETEQLLSKLKNDFEPLVRQHYPAVDEAMKWLSNFGKARLSGSGSSVFACFNDEAQAKKCFQEMPSSFKGFIAKGANLSSLKIKLAQSDCTVSAVES